MTRPSALFLAVAAFAALARSARADDSQTAAAAAQVLSQVGGAAGAGAAPGAAGGHKKDEGGFSRPLSAPKIEKTSGGDEKPAPAKKKAAVKAAKPSKYLSRDLTEHSESNYRFNDRAEPLDSAPKTKPAAKPKKKASSEPDDKADKTGACTSDEPCPAKNSVGDAF
jgi:hypothetical protein